MSSENLPEARTFKLQDQTAGNEVIFAFGGESWVRALKITLDII